MGHVAQNNVIPATAELRLDVRLTPGLEPGGVLGAIEELARDTERRCPGTRITVEPVEPPRPATRVDRSEAIVKALEWAVRRVSGRRPVFGGVPGSTDGTILRTVLGIPIVTFGPGNRLIPHQVDEHVSDRRARRGRPLLRRGGGAVSLASWLRRRRPRSSARSRPSRRGWRTARSSACAIRPA